MVVRLLVGAEWRRGMRFRRERVKNNAQRQRCDRTDERRHGEVEDFARRRNWEFQPVRSP
jgi:hypothetical protein